MKTECPICGQPRSNTSEPIGSRVVCKACRTPFEVRHVASEEEQEAAAESRSLIMATFLPIATFCFVVFCSIHAEISHQRSVNRSPQPSHSSAAPPHVPPAAFQNHRRSGTGNRSTQNASSSAGVPGQSGSFPSSAYTPPENLFPRAEDVRLALEDSSVPLTELIPKGELRSSTVVIKDDPNDPPEGSLSSPPLPRFTTQPIAFKFENDFPFYNSFNGSAFVSGVVNEVKSETQNVDGQYEATCVSDHIGNIIGLADGRVIMWTARGERWVSPHHHADRVIAVGRSGLGHCSCSADGTVMQGSYLQGDAIRWVLPAKPISARFEDRDQLIIGCSDNRVLLGAGPQMNAWRSFRSAVAPQCVCISSGGSYLAVAGGNRAEIRSVGNFDLQQVFQLPLQVTSVALSEDGTLLAVGQNDSRVIVYCTYSRRVTATVDTPGIPIELSLQRRSKSLNIGTSTGQLLQAELANLDLRAKVEASTVTWTPLAKRKDAKQWDSLTSFQNEVSLVAYNQSLDTVRELIAETGRHRRRIQFFKRIDQQTIVGLGCGLKAAERVLLLEDGGSSEVTIKAKSEDALFLQWDSPGDRAPIMLVDFGDSMAVTVPIDLKDAGPETLSKDKEDELYIMRPYKKYETLNDKFRLLLLTPHSEITKYVKGQGIIIAQEGATLPKTIQGHITLVRTKKHPAPLRSIAGDSPEVVVDTLNINPIPNILPGS